MKVLHVNDYAWAGGCEVLMNDTVGWLNERGITAEVFTTDEIVNYRRTPLSYIDSHRCRRALRRRVLEPLRNAIEIRAPVQPLRTVRKVGVAIITSPIQFGQNISMWSNDCRSLGIAPP